MKRFIFFVVFVFSLTFTLNAQDFNYSTVGDPSAPTYQAVPDEAKLLSDIELGKSFQYLGIVAQPDKENFGFVLINVSPNDYQLDKQETPYFIFETGKRAYTISDFKITSKKKVKKMRVELMTIKVTRVIFEDIVLSKNLSLNFGALQINIPSSNIEALRFVGEQVSDRYETINTEKRAATSAEASSPRSSSTSSGGSVQVKGYYRRDGTYVRPHTRKSPRRKN